MDKGHDVYYMVVSFNLYARFVDVGEVGGSGGGTM